MALILLKKTRQLTNVVTRALSSRLVNQDEEDHRKKVLIETEELDELIASGAPDLKVINATWYHKTNAEHQALQDHLSNRLPNSIFLNHEDLIMTHEDHAQLIPTLSSFTAQMKRLFIKPTDSLVCYDDYGLYSSPRLAWTFNYFGAQNVRVLNGGLLKWRREGRRVDSGPQKILASPKRGVKAEKWEINYAHRAEQATNPIHKAAYYVANKLAKT